MFFQSLPFKSSQFCKLTYESKKDYSPCVFLPLYNSFLCCFAKLNWFYYYFVIIENFRHPTTKCIVGNWAWSFLPWRENFMQRVYGMALLHLCYHFLYLLDAFHRLITKKLIFNLYFTISLTLHPCKFYNITWIVAFLGIKRTILHKFGNLQNSANFKVNSISASETYILYSIMEKW